MLDELFRLDVGLSQQAAQMTPTMAALLRRNDVRAIMTGIGQLGPPAKFEYDGKETVDGFDRHKYRLEMNTTVARLQKLRVQIGWEPGGKLDWFVVEF